MSHLRTLALCLTLLHGACSARTELIVGITTDLVGVPDPLRRVHFTVQRNGSSIVDQTWTVGPDGPQDLPGSVGIYTDDGSTAHLIIELTGTLQSGKSLKRDAVVDLAHGATLFMRMMLAQSCVDKRCEGHTCVEGQCRPLSMDDSQLPTYQEGMALGLECDSGSLPRKTRDGQKMEYRLGPGPAACDSRSSCIENTCYRLLSTCSSGAQGTTQVNLVTDVANCGACGVACASVPFSTAQCASGTCGFACFAGRADCDNVSSTGCEVDTTSDAKSCGACGTFCSAVNAVTSCTRGACAITSCAAGYGDCNRSYDDGCEVAIGTDVSNCGKCGSICPAANGEAACVAGVCSVAACAQDFADCDQLAKTGCEAALRTDPLNCGGCGKNCSLPHAIAVCAGGRCMVMSCDVGFADCDEAPANGCETDLGASADNCGACNVACSSQNMQLRTCAAGKCSGTCATGYADCDGNLLSNGCEVSISSDPKHCGSCKTVCAMIQVCSSSSCQQGCSGGKTNCSQACVDLTSDAQHCGSCMTPCAASNAISSCTSSQCTFKCTIGFVDCNGIAGDGCEVNTQSDPDHCGNCTASCFTHNNNLPNPTCAKGTCGGTCAVGFADCDGNKYTDGCETNLNSDMNNCGNCGVKCSTNNIVAACNNGTCNGTCAAGYADCNTNKQSDGCERNLNTDPDNCSTCGQRCSSQNVAARTCTNGTCSGTCSPGFADCNKSLLTDGCETNTGTDPYNCGGCKAMCSPFAIMTLGCAGGVCSGTCLSGWDDCNHDKRADGCETPITTDKNCGACGVVCPGIQHCKAGKCVL